MVNNFDTSYAVTLSKIMETTLSSYSASPDSLLGKLSELSFEYGAPHLIRPIAHPYQDVQIAPEFMRVEQEPTKKVQNLDLHSVSDTLIATKKEMAGDPQNVAMHIAAHHSIFLEGIEKTFMEGCSDLSLIYGLIDYPNGTAGTINRPEMAGSIATAGDWNTQANMRADLINAKVALIAKKFYGRPALLCPSQISPVFSQVITNTSDPNMNWVTRDLGMDLWFSPFVHEAATKDDFNCYLIDPTKIHLAVSQTQLESYYEPTRRAQLWDWEVQMTVAFDPLHDGTEWVKGCIRLDARDFSD